MKDIELTEEQLKEKEKIEKLRHHFFDDNNYTVCTVVELPSTIDLSNFKESELQEKLDEKMLPLCTNPKLFMRRKRLEFEKDFWKEITEEEIENYMKNEYPIISKDDYTFRFEHYGNKTYLVVFGVDCGFLNSISIKSEELKSGYNIIFSREICWPALQFLLEYIFDKGVWCQPMLNNYEMQVGKKNEKELITHGFEIDNDSNFITRVACSKEENKCRDEYYELIFPTLPK